MAKKNPWYPMYASDWNNDTAEWPLEADGALIRLMNHQAINGSLPSDMPSLARICRVHTKVITRLYRVYLQFKFDSNGFRIKNKRLSLVLEEQAAKQLNLSERGMQGSDKRWLGHPRKDSILESESDTDIELKIKKEKSSLKIELEKIDYEITDQMAEAVRVSTLNGFPNFDKDPKLRDKWANQAKLLRIQDKRDPEITQTLIEKLKNGDFDTDKFQWSKQIQSISKLRKRNPDGRPYWDIIYELSQALSPDQKRKMDMNKFMERFN